MPTEEEDAVAAIHATLRLCQSDNAAISKRAAIALGNLQDVLDLIDGVTETDLPPPPPLAA